ncbi:FHA domain-containing protein [Pseudobutyrivibrio sp.]|uniref:FHA domain-containing protein n=1 Tax=Pseudobutyrivibrio sp. TaxID=2014367 RepID=UPI0025D78A45|nr:FHA domain-containing protein [Pseudobutyrivibrio sp.]
MISIDIAAANKPKVMATYTLNDTDDHIVSIYVRDGVIGDEASFQIGSTPTEKPDTYSISEYEMPMRTLIMLDNSLSIPQNSRAQILDLMVQVINNHCQNEQFRIATFSTNINYLTDRYTDDYTSLVNIVNNITYNDQDTLLTDVLYGVIDDLKVEGYLGYTRIIVITDGVNNKPVGGKSLDMVKETIRANQYPIYTIGCNTGKNDDLLDNLFSLSWLKDCEYVVFDNSKVAEIAGVFTADNNIVVYEAEIPEEIMDGTPRKGKLTLGDGTELVMDVSIPFANASAVEPDSAPGPEPEPEKVCICEEKCTEENYNSNCPVCGENYLNCECETEIEEAKRSLPWTIYAGIAILLIAAIGATVYFILSKKTNTPEETEDDNLSGGRQGTLAFDEDAGRQGTLAFDENGTASFMPGDISGIITLTDKNNRSKSWRHEIVDKITIGRNASDYKDTINFQDDENPYMHGHHCSIEYTNGEFYIMDTILNKSKRTHTKVNGNKMEEGVPYSISSGDEITIGNQSYIIEIDRA